MFIVDSYCGNIKPSKELSFLIFVADQSVFVTIYFNILKLLFASFGLFFKQNDEVGLII